MGNFQIEINIVTTLRIKKSISNLYLTNQSQYNYNCIVLPLTFKMFRLACEPACVRWIVVLPATQAKIPTRLVQ